MLQQTQAARVEPAYRRFIRRFPSLHALARASRAEVLQAWGGLGYNRRALSLSQAARSIAREYGGRLPADPDALRSLPGVGPYTAAAVSSIAFGLPVAAVDTNVRRVVSRVFLGIDTASAADVGELADRWLDRRDPGRWNQALMDLGRRVCRPRPACERCPLAPRCRFLLEGAEPRSAARAPVERFEGSSRQARGAVVRALRTQRARSFSSLVRETGLPAERVRAAVRALAAEGLVAAGPGARAGHPDGRVRLGS
jgi:A/G-specific adenine glycosylase